MNRVNMDRVNYDEYINRLKKKSSRFHIAWEAQFGRGARSGRPRDAEEDIVLFLLDRKRWQKALADGSVEKIGPRRYRMR
jgi:hypothetical protein